MPENCDFNIPESCTHTHGSCPFPPSLLGSSVQLVATTCGSRREASTQASRGKGAAEQLGGPAFGVSAQSAEKKRGSGPSHPWLGS